jgi:glutamine synthetase type III
LVNATNFVVIFPVLNPQGQKPVWVTSGDDINAHSIKNVTIDREIEPVLQQTSELHVQFSRSASSEELAKQEQCLKSWENLQTEVQDTHQLFEEFSLLVQVR